MEDKRLALKYLGIPINVNLDHKEIVNKDGSEPTSCMSDSSAADASTQCVTPKLGVVSYKSLESYTNDSDSEDLSLRDLAYRIGCKRVFVNDFDSDEDIPLLYLKNRPKRQCFKC